MANDKVFLGFPFQEEIFRHAWETEPDLATELLINSGVLIPDSRITAELSGGGYSFRAPHYKPLGGEPVLYNGKTDIPSDEIEGGDQVGIAWGFAKSWKERDFVKDLVGNDPMGHIVRSVARYWQQFKQGLLVKIVDASLDATGMSSHKAKVEYDPEKPETVIAELNTQLAKVFRNGRSAVRVLMMNTNTAVKFENIKMLTFEKGVDANAMHPALRVGTLLGMQVLVDDSAVEADDVIYAFGAGSILTGSAPVLHPVGWQRSEDKNGGETAIYTRVRGVFHPNGMSYTVPDTIDGSPTIAELTAKANWKPAFDDHKTIPLAKLTVSEKAAPVGP